MGFELQLIEGKIQQKTFPIVEGKIFSLGRSKNCDYWLDINGISRKHCCVWIEKGHVWIEDAQSSNGTGVNTRKISEKTKLEPGNIITINVLKFRLEFNLDSRILHTKNKDEETFTLDSSKTNRDLIILHEVGKLVQSKLPVVQLLEEVLEIILSMFHCERGAIFFKSHYSQSNLHSIHRSFCDGVFGKEGFSVSTSILKMSLQEGISTISADTLADPKLKNSISVIDMEIRSILCVCLEGQNGNWGVIYLDSKRVNSFNKHDLELITAVGRQLAVAIEKSVVEKQLIASEQFSIIKHSRDVIYRCDLNFKFNIISPSIENILGISTKEILKSPQTWKSHIHEEDKDAFNQMRKDVLLGKECSLKYRLINFQGEIVWVEESCYLIKENQLTCIQGVVKNITKTKLLHILGSAPHITKAIMNIVINGFHAMPKGGTLKISTEKTFLNKTLLKHENMNEGEYAMLKISDTGVGITANNLDKIFEPFFSKRQNKPGTGLGLAIACGAIQNHGGYIDVESSLGKGTSFTIYLPLQKHRNQKIKIQDENLLGSGSLLVVDDIKEQRELVRDILTSLGYQVHTVASGEEALIHLATNQVDLVFLDMIMEKGMDGLETCRKIKNILPQLHVVIVSGFSKPKRVEEALKIGAKAYIRKPYTIDEIGKVTKEVLKASLVGV